MDKLNVAVIGCGFFGSMHAEVYAQAETVRLAGVADLSAEKAAEVAARFDTSAYTDYNELIERSDIDIVDICLPDSMHRDAALKAVECGKHILIEKPLADSPEAIRDIMAATEHYGKKVMVAHICRFDLRYEKAYEAIRGGDLGEIIYVSSKRNSPTLGAKRYAKYCKLLTHSGVHDIDLIRWFLGSEYQSVYAVGRKVRMVNEGFPGAFDSIQALYTFENGVTYSLENTWAMPDRFPSYIDAGISVVGTKAALFLDFANQGYNIASNDGYVQEDISFWPEAMGKRTGDLRAELMHFVDCVRFDKTPRVSVQDGYAVSLAAVRAFESIETGGVVQI